jgi:hypothetical protein
MEEGKTAPNLKTLHMEKWGIRVKRVRKINREQALFLSY